MSRYDWIPMEGYGDSFSLTSTTTRLEIPLLDLAQWTSANLTEGTYENYQELFVERIVGQFRLTSSDVVNQAGVALLRILPGIVDIDNASVLTPGTFESAGVNFNSAVSANGRFWWERRVGIDFQVLEPGGSLSFFTHPWWTNIDIHPRQKLGPLEVPVMSISVATPPNGDSTTLFQAWLRLLVKPV